MLALLATVLTPVGAATAAEGDDPVTFTVGLKNEVDSFNPFLGVEAASYEMWALAYDYLVGYSMDDMSPEPALAESWETSDDGLTWTFDVREGVTWSDGEPFTAADVAYTYGRVLDGGPEAVTWASYLSQVERVEAPDDTTVVMTLKKPNAVLPLLPIPILPEHVWKDVPESAVKTFANEPSDGEPIVGTGPFELIEGKAGGPTYRFVANEDYWGGAPHVDEVDFRVFKAEDPMVQALIKGEVDFIHDISPLQVEALKGQGGITSINGASPYFEEIGFNTGAQDEDGDKLGDGNPALEDPAFRHALGYAVDLERLVEAAYQGAATPGDVVVPPAYPGFRLEVSEDDAFSFDLDKADELLVEAGYETDGDGTRLMPDGSPVPTMRLFARTEEKRSVTTMDFFSEWLGELGIDSEVTPMESSRLTEVILEGEYDAFQWGWYVEPDPDAILDVFTCAQRGGWSDSWFCDPEYDELMAAQKTELDDDARVETIREMQQILFDQSPYLVLAYTTSGQAWRSDRFACFVPQPDPDGVLLMQYGTYNYRLLRPVADAGDCDGVARAIGPEGSAGTVGGDDDGGGGLMLALGGGALAVLAAGGVLYALRRRSTAEDRE